MKETSSKIMKGEGDRAEALASRIEALITEARAKVVSVVNTAMVYTYYEIGRMIVEDEQGGKERADYGKKILQGVSERLTDKLGKGFSVDNLQNMRNFYNCYSKYATVSRISSNSHELPHFTLSWSHYLKLMRITAPAERSFYEIEATNNHWSLRELERQFDSSLYERLALSRNKEEVLQLSKKGQIVEKTKDLLKRPVCFGIHGAARQRTTKTYFNGKIIF